MVSVAADSNDTVVFNMILKELAKFSAAERKMWLNEKDNDGRTALMYAVMSKNGETVYKLLAMGASKTIQDNDGKTAEDVAQLMQYRDATVMKWMFPDSGGILKQGETPLIRNINEAKFEEARKLIQVGANQNKQDNDGNTALMLAVNANDLRLVKLLYSKHPDLSLKNNTGKTAFDIARSSSDQIADYFFKKQQMTRLYFQGGIVRYSLSTGEGSDETILSKWILEDAQKYQQPGKKIDFKCHRIYLPGSVFMAGLPKDNNTTTLDGGLEAIDLTLMDTFVMSCDVNEVTGSVTYVFERDSKRYEDVCMERLKESDPDFFTVNGFSQVVKRAIYLSDNPLERQNPDQSNREYPPLIATFIKGNLKHPVIENYAEQTVFLRSNIFPTNSSKESENEIKMVPTIDDNNLSSDVVATQMMGLMWNMNDPTTEKKWCDDVFKKCLEGAIPNTTPNTLNTCELQSCAQSETIRHYYVGRDQHSEYNLPCALKLIYLDLQMEKSKSSEESIGLWKTRVEAWGKRIWTLKIQRDCTLCFGLWYDKANTRWYLCLAGKGRRCIFNASNSGEAQRSALINALDKIIFDMVGNPFFTCRMSVPIRTSQSEDPLKDTWSEMIKQKISKQITNMPEVVQNRRVQQLRGRNRRPPAAHIVRSSERTTATIIQKYVSECVKCNLPHYVGETEETRSSHCSWCSISSTSDKTTETAFHILNQHFVLNEGWLCPISKKSVLQRRSV